MTNTKLFPNSCQVCEGDLWFSIGLDGATLKCLQCSRTVTRDGAAKMLASLQIAKRTEKAVQPADQALRQAA